MVYPDSLLSRIQFKESCKFCMGTNRVTRKIATCLSGKKYDFCPEEYACVEEDGQCKAKCEPILGGCSMRQVNGSRREMKPIGCNVCDESGYKIVSCMDTTMGTKFTETLHCPVGRRCAQHHNCEAWCTIVDTSPCVVPKMDGNGKYNEENKFDGCYFCSDNNSNSLNLCGGKDGIKNISCHPNEVCIETTGCRAECHLPNFSLSLSLHPSQILLPATIILLILLILTCILFIRQRSRYKNLKKRHQIYVIETQANMNPLVLIKSNELLVHDRKLGGGEFGNVYSGKYVTKDGKYPVAIKILKGVEEQELMKEAGIMAQLDHQNLTKLIGVSLAENIKIVTPLRPMGSLEDFLKKHKNGLKSKELVIYDVSISAKK